ncbi:MAG: hypothetical protein LUI09_00745 [Prevotellaceae bacterium]|nr:hypothetical protein [Prevotellaceae bacterium]
MKRGLTNVRWISLLCLLAFSSCHRKQTFEERMLEEIAAFNQREVPKRMDEVTVMDSLRYEPESRSIAYFYTLEGLADNDSVLTEELRDQQREGLLGNLRGSIQLKPYKEQGLSFEYRYYSHKSGKLLMRFAFTADDYNQ